ncbi:MAG TPA: rhomboid family intramembrane serine protease [Methylomirabilota bacterium]|nr:rhomboid family intramembrane serine protease [Methylomirabilota bacterium]
MTEGEPEQPLRITPDMLLGRRVDFERRMRRAPPVTVGLIIVLTGVFLIELAVGALDSREAMIAAGALEANAVAAGEYWRLVAATLLHGGPDHLFGNAVALFILGMVCEHAFGWRQFLLLFTASGLSGSVVSLLSGAGPSVGASGAIFGLQAAAIVLFRRHRDRLLMRDRRIGFVLLVWAIYAIASGIRDPYVDNGAHIGGALGGALVGRRLHAVVLAPMTPERAARLRWKTWALWALLAYTLAGWVIR